MTLVLAYWIAVSAVGLLAANACLRRSRVFTNHLKKSRALPVPREELLTANRGEIIRDLFLVGGLAINLLIGITGAFAATKIPAIRSITGAAALVGLLGNATLLSLLASFNYWLRRSR